MMRGTAAGCVETLTPSRCRSAQRSGTGFVSNDSRLQLPLAENAIILGVKAGRQPGGRPPIKLPP
jgi:hypothetical protein